MRDKKNQNDDGLDIPEDDDLLLAACHEWESAESETSTHPENTPSVSTSSVQKKQDVPLFNQKQVSSVVR